MTLKTIALLLLLPALMLLLVACDEQPLATEVSPIPITTPPPWGLLTSLPVAVESVLEQGSCCMRPSSPDKRDSESDFEYAHRVKWMRTFIGFGSPQEEWAQKELGKDPEDLSHYCEQGDASEGTNRNVCADGEHLDLLDKDEFSAAWIFRVPKGTPVLAPITGYVWYVMPGTSTFSGSEAVWLRAEHHGVAYNQMWQTPHWRVSRVVDVQVKNGDFVEAGQPIATASVVGGTGMVKLALYFGESKTEHIYTPSSGNREGAYSGSRVTAIPHYVCPLLHVDEDALPVIYGELNQIRKENVERLESHGISIPGNDPDGQSCWTDLPITW